MEYTQLEIRVSPLDPFRDWLTFMLAESGFDMFNETETGFNAFILTEKYSADRVEQVCTECRALGAEVEFKVTHIPWQNWNAEWEAQFQPEWISGRVLIRAEHHVSDPSAETEIVIQPRMAFGTGHHPTTALVMEAMLDLNFNGKAVIDMGCGTAILAILAVKYGADHVLAIDNDPNSVENAKENADRNGCGDKIDALLGDANSLSNQTCDIFIANINRNIILQDIDSYLACINSGGLLITSGYYEQDLPQIRAAAESRGMHFNYHLTRDEWCCALFNRN